MRCTPYLGMVKLTLGQYNKKEKYEISDSEEAWA